MCGFDPRGWITTLRWRSPAAGQWHAILCTAFCRFVCDHEHDARKWAFVLHGRLRKELPRGRWSCWLSVPVRTVGHQMVCGTTLMAFQRSSVWSYRVRCSTETLSARALALALAFALATFSEERMFDFLVCHTHKEIPAFAFALAFALALSAHKSAQAANGFSHEVSKAAFSLFIKPEKVGGNPFVSQSGRDIAHIVISFTNR